LGDQIKDEMDGACSKMREMGNAYTSLVRRPNFDVRIILIRDIRREDMYWIQLSQDRV
jgi:hypothetical protein